MSSTTAIDLERLCAWSAPREVRTGQGPRLLRTAPPSDEFKRLFGSAKSPGPAQAELRAAGMGWGKDYKTQEWQVCWWQPLSREQAAAVNAAVEASRATDADVEIPVPPGLAYLPFQKAGIAYMRDHPRTLLADEMGLGKTVQAIGLANMEPAIRKVLVVCPASLKVNWRNELARWLVRPLKIAVQGAGEPWAGGWADVVVINYDILDRYPEMYAAEWDLLVADEAHFCFPAGTMVSTSAGTVAIEDIVNRRQKLSVITCNLSRNSLENRRVTGFTKVRRYTRLVRIEHEHGTLTCTDDHQVWTDGGWKEARAIRRGESLRVLRKTVPHATQREKHQPILHEALCGNIQNVANGGATTPFCFPDEMGEKALRMVQEKLQVSFAWSKWKQQASVLWEQLCGIMEKQPTRICRTEEKVQPCWSPSIDWKAPAGFVIHNDTKKPNAGKEDSTKRRPQRQDLFGAWREWEINGASKIVGGGTRMADGSRYWNGKSARNVSMLARLLQGGYRLPGIKGCRGGGRTQPQVEKMAIPGSPERRSIICSRVVSVEVLERGNPGEPKSGSVDGEYLYCLEVEGNHNFFANGVLVSNCKNPKVKRTRLLLGSRSKRDRNEDGSQKFPGVKAKWLALMSGTPLLNRPVELFPLLEALMPGKWTFKDKVRYCAGVRDRFGWNFDGSAHLDELQTRLRSTCMVRRLKSEVMKDLPAKRRQVIELPANGAAKLVREELDGWERYEDGMAEAEAEKAVAELAGDEEVYKAAVAKLKAAVSAAFEDMARVRHEVAVAKAPKVAEHVRNVMEDAGKCVVFVHHHDVTDLLAGELADFRPLVVDGRTPVDGRQRIVDEFNQEPGRRVLILGIKAAGVGLSVRASVEVFAEFDWTPGAMSQAEDRCYGIGRGVEGEPLLVQHMVLEGSLDAKMCKTLVAKQDVADRALDKGAAAAAGQDMVTSVTVGSVLEDDRRERASRAGRKADGKPEEPEAPVGEELREHVHAGLRRLAGMDGDFAQELNGIGFNKMDCAFGHALAERGRLSDAMARCGVRLVIKYGRQLGDAYRERLDALRGVKQQDTTKGTQA